MKQAHILNKTITLSYICDDENSDVKHIENMSNFHIEKRQHFSDWEYDCIEFTCPVCGNLHIREIN